MPIFAKNGLIDLSKAESKKPRSLIERINLLSNKPEPKVMEQPKVAKSQPKPTLTTKVKKEKVPADYGSVRLIMDGKERIVTKASKWLLDMMTKD